MPLSRTLYQYSCRGFICKSCVSKALCPRRPWASRNITNGSGKPKKGHKGVPRSSRGDESQSGIKYFMQRADGTREEIDELGPMSEANLREKIATVEKQLAKLRGGKVLDSWLKSGEDDIADEEEVADETSGSTEDKSEELEVARKVSALNDEQREELLAGMRVMMERLDEPREPHPTYNFDPELDGSINDEAFLRLQKFIRMLKEVALGNEFTQSQQKGLWKHYSINRFVLRRMQDQAPPDIYDFLWTVFAQTAILNPERLGRLKILAEDMVAAGKTLQDTQLLVYLEAWYLTGPKKEALNRWRSLTGSLGAEKSAVFQQFWELGTKMLAADARPQEALDAAIVLFRGAPDADPRIIVPIIASWATSNDDKRMMKAWALYQRLRSALSGDIEMKDFDAITMIFLGADEPGLALGVFRDMMATQKEKLEAASTPVLDDVFEKRNLDVINKGMDEIDWTAFEALAHLPKNKRNKFFFGSWIKKLLGEKEVTAALQVLQLMRQYRVRPDAIQLNGVVGALLRSKTVKGQATGEQIAWDMIKARKEFLDATQRVPVLFGPSRPVFSAGKDDFRRAVGDLRYTPPATAETLAILIENYRRRNLHQYVQDFWGMLNTLQLRPNTYILNQFLLSYHKARDPWTAMEILHQCVDIHHVQPDLDTIKWLWQHLKQRKLLKSPPTAASARRLFAFSMKYLPPYTTTSEDKTLMAEIYDLVILCFGLVDDQIGTAIAIRTFQERLGMYPQPETPRKIIAQLAATPNTMNKLAANIPYVRPPRGRRTEINTVLNSVMKNRSEELKAQGINLALMDDKAKGQESINMLTELLKSLYVSKSGELAETKEEKRVEQGKVSNLSVDELRVGIEKTNIKSAADMMGVPEIRPWSK